ncbi:UNVERIFIED_CONTAM: hypothetical protein Sradi_5679700 [Sesamum radiatum]|uniref:Uncharacterized protein n=1 Tax=Sesamum radiatum TaxID=300843 RepID=A0AAW2L2K7_SESRA
MPRKSRASSSGETAPSSATEVSSDAMAQISGTSSTMSEKAIKKMVSFMALPPDFECVYPKPSDRANQPPPGCLTVYASQVLSGFRLPFPSVIGDLFSTLGIPPSQLLPNSFRLLVGFCLCSQLYHFQASVENLLGVFTPILSKGECFFYLSPRPGLTFIKDKPSSYGSWKTRFFFVRRSDWTIPVSWARSLNPLPSINVSVVRESMLAVGLLSHCFNAKSIVDTELLIVSGIQPGPDPYEGPEDRYTRFRKYFLLHRIFLLLYI